LPPESVADIVIVVVPAEPVGVPVIAPVDVFKDNPVWNAPDTIAYVIVDEPSASVA
jgi:hypothetical protein